MLIFSHFSTDVSKIQTSATLKGHNRSPMPQYAIVNNPPILPQVPGSPTNRSFAAALRNLAKQIGPGHNTSSGKKKRT